MTRFRFLPGVRRVHLRPNWVQLGSDPERCGALEVPDSRFLALLERLDGWLDEAGYLTAARRLGLTGDQAHELLDLLRGQGYVVDSTTLAEGGRRLDPGREAAALALRRRDVPARLVAHRRRQRVFVNGVGALAHRIAAGLRAAEFGRVWCADDARRGKATVSVLVNCAHPPLLTARGYARRRLPYLVVAVLDGSVHVGPMVRPGTGPCLRCVHLHYHDRLPVWHRPQTPDLLEAPVTDVASGWIGTVMTQYVDTGACEADAATIQIRPGLDIAHRLWSVHPRCGCA